MYLLTVEAKSPGQAGTGRPHRAVQGAVMPDQAPASPLGPDPRVASAMAYLAGG